MWSYLLTEAAPIWRVVAGAKITRKITSNYKHAMLLRVGILIECVDFLEQRMNISVEFQQQISTTN